MEACEQHNKILCNQKVELLQRITELSSLCDNVGELTKLVEEKDKEMQGLIEIHHAQDADLEAYRDQFCIGFVEWIRKEGWRPEKSYDKWMKYLEDQFSLFRTTEELLELYKQSLKPV